MMKNSNRKVISLLLSVLIAISGIVPAFSAFAGDGVDGVYDLQIFYKDTNTIVPTKVEGTEDDYIDYLVEGEKLALKYVLIDSEWPDNAYVKWYSDAPALVDVDQDGLVKAFDSSKGAVIHTWIDNEVKTIPLLGSVLGSALEKVFFNEYVDLDTMDTDEIVGLLEKFFGSGSAIADASEGYQGELIDSLRSYLDKANTGIHCELYDNSGTKIGEDVIKIVVTKNEEWYAQFLPNGTHITNKSQIPTTVAKGSEVQLYGIVTPQRLGFGVVYSVKSTSIFSTGKVVATVNDSGLVSFKNKGEVTIMCSPDSEEVIEAILKFVNYFYALENTGTLDTDKIAGILIDYVGIDMNRTVLAGILDVCFAVKDIAGDVADPVQLTATAVEILANIILQFTYNDTITFTVVDAQPLEAFDLDGVSTVKEGNEIKLEVTNIVPSTGDTTDIVWSSSDPSIASVDPKTGVIKGLDAGGALGAVSSQTCLITATSTTNNVKRSVTVTVTGRTGKYISHVDINGSDIVPIEGSEKYTYTVYPQRVADSDCLFVTWGIVAGEDEDGNPQYLWASEDEPAVDPDNVGQMDYRGVYTPIKGGVSTIALQAKTGYRLSDGSFYEISNVIATKEIQTGIPVEKIQISVLGGTSNGDINRDNTFELNGKSYQYVTIKKGVGEAYMGNGASLSATVYPDNATDKTVKWVIDNNNYKLDNLSEDTSTVDVKQKAGEENADTFNVYAVSNDGEIVSNIITVCVTRNYSTSNTIDQDAVNMINGKTAEATHSMTFDGSWTSSAYACHKANWYSSDETVFTVENKGNDNSDAVLTAQDVGVATLYCVSADGALVDSVEVTVRPDKERLKGIIDICEKSIVLRTNNNKADYQTYLRKLDKANIVYYEEDMASQLVCDTVANDLLSAFIRIGGFIGIAGVEILGTNKSQLNTDFVTVQVGSTSNYKNYYYDFDYALKPANAMYSDIEWTSSNSSISVDKNGKCSPTSNDPCSAVITCTVTDYNGGVQSASKVVAFARTKATGVTLNKTEITDAKIGESYQLEATVQPTNVLGNSTASVKDCRWYTSNPSVVTVDESGKITYEYGGVAYITCETMDGGYQATCKVTVVTNYDALRLLINQYDDLQLREENFYPETWAPYIKAKTEAEQMVAQENSSQEEVDAKYTELKTAYQGLKKFVDIQRVELYLDGEATSDFYQYDLSLLKEGISYKNAKLNLKVRLFPNNATYQAVKWESSTPDISVTNDGVASPTSSKACYGNITCTVTDSFGRDFTDDVWVSYSYVPVTAINVSMDSITGTIGETYKLTAVVEPQGSSLTHAFPASIQDYFWASDDESVATVDQTGLVTFTGAGSTSVKCISYDGGIYGECKVSSQGDRTALKAALEEYKDVDYTQYAYDYGMAFKTAYENAQSALTNDGLSQEGIDAATEALVNAADLLPAHPYINVEAVNLSWNSQKRNLSNSITQVGSGTVGSNNSVGIDLSSNFSNYNDYNDLIITASASPTNSMYKNINWEVLQSWNISYSTSLSKITFTPSQRTQGAWAKVRVNYVSHYDVVTSRIFYIAFSDNPTTSLTVEETNLTLKGSADPYQLNYSVNSGAEITDVVFTSSDENVATVSDDGKITPVEVGTCTIYAQTLYGGITKEVSVEITADFSVLANKVAEYTELLNNAQGTNEFTQESLDALGAEIAYSKAIVDEGKATQREVNEALRRLEIARQNLEGYTPAEGIGIDLSKESADTEIVNPGFIRYTNNTLNNKSIQLLSQVKPEGSRYQTLTWTSDSDIITVTNDGLVTCTSGTTLGAVAKITCTITTIYGQTYAASVYVSFVRVPVSGVSFTSELVYGAPNETKAVPVKFESAQIANPSLKKAIYTSADESIATVDADGNVTFHSQGDTTITVVALDGGYSGTINARTTWDTTALKEALNQANAVVSTDYEYAYIQALEEKKTAAQTVYDNPYATQEEIDAACTELITALTALEGHEFIIPTFEAKINGEDIVDNMTYEVDPETKQLTVNCQVIGTMYKSVEITTQNEDGATAVVNGTDIVITKTADTGIVGIKAVITDDYDRTYTYEYTIKLVDTIVNIESISITYNGEVIDTMKNLSGYGYGYTTFEAFTLGYVSNTPNSSVPVSVKWTSSNSSYITIDENTGLVDLTAAGKFKATNTANITCTVTNTDGTTATKTISLTIAR